MDLRAGLFQASSACIISGVHAMSFQPLSVTNEDRYFVEEWPLRNGMWKMLAVFDGHGAGTETVDFVLATLPPQIKSALVSKWRTETPAEFTALLPKANDIGDLSPEAIREALLDPDSNEGHSRVEVLRARTGTTALIALVHPSNSIHVASLGDCDAVLATKEDAGWRTKILSARHNCTNECEVARTRAEHPDEAECVNTETRRILGLIAVTRALGDTLFKLPAVYTERVAPASMPPIHPNYDLKGLAARNLTAPYLSNIAEVTHVAPPQSDARRLLILASDGLINILSRSKNVRELSEAVALWLSAAVADVSKSSNMAVDLLWDSLQPQDGENLYKSILEGQYRGRVDDITIVVCSV
ncbi:phosphatase 2C-like domain-containing protein [Mycena capillaripes]|nr:phosphatase 2C-like domain-containing protein [Mycena capillaripes]